MTKMPNYISTTNACKLCKPLGATLAFRGIEGSVPFLHGSQGCATYMRRYIISHFNEPMDIASSSLGEKNAIFGGGPNLKLGLKNVTEKFAPKLIGIATTCLTETIGDDLPMLLTEYHRERGAASESPVLVNVSTPSYAGTHMEGFHAAVRAVTVALAERNSAGKGINILPGMTSAADLRHLKEILTAYQTPFTLLPDFSETLDGEALTNYEKIPRGGTKLAAVKGMGGSIGTIEFASVIADKDSAGFFLDETFGVTNHRLNMPIGIRATDVFFDLLGKLLARETPTLFTAERGRLLDALADGHKYLYGKRAVVYGEEDLVVGLSSFLAEIGIHPVLCASGGKSGKLKAAVNEVCGNLVPTPPEILEDMDFYGISALAAPLEPDFIIGHSKGAPLARKLKIPLIRVGFPIHDRFGGQRLLHFGYRGAQSLFDTIVNALLDKNQNDSEIGYSYM